MKLIIDVNLSPAWVSFLGDAGYETVHWSDIGALRAPDRQIMAWAREHDRVVFTHDLDFAALLAATQARAPSVLQIRAQDTLPDAMGEAVVQALRQFAQALREGAVVSVDLSTRRGTIYRAPTTARPRARRTPLLRMAYARLNAYPNLNRPAMKRALETTGTVDDEGRLHLDAPPPALEAGRVRVLLLFEDEEGGRIDLRARGIGAEEAAALRERLASFAGEWESKEMSLYDDYDAARS